MYRRSAHYLSGHGGARFRVGHDSIIPLVLVAPEVLGSRHYLGKQPPSRSRVVILVRAGGVEATAFAPSSGAGHRTGGGAQQGGVDVCAAAVALLTILQTVEDVVGGVLARVRAQLYV